MSRIWGTNMRLVTRPSAITALLVVATHIFLVSQVARAEETDADTVVFVHSPQVLKEQARLETKYPEQSLGIPKYAKSGHQYTTYIVARQAGMNWARAHKVAFYSQFPDDVSKYDAIYVAVFSLFNLDYRKRIMALLHSLHGGNADAVRQRQDDLEALIIEGVVNDSLEDYQLGLLIHAFADSFAHTKVSNGELEAFGYVYGHLFHWKTPDLISSDPDKYKNYTCRLYKALARKPLCEPALQPLFQLAEGLAISRNKELPAIEELARKGYNYEENIVKTFKKEWVEVVSKQDVLDTINLIEERVESRQIVSSME